MEELKKKARQLEVVAAMCKVNLDDVIDDITDSMEISNKCTKPLHSQDETKDPYLQWWATFMEEWSQKCCRMWLSQYGDSKDYQKMHDWWFVFEILWVAGCDIVRLTRLNDLREGISKFIARKSPSKSDIGEIWRWHNESTKQLDEAIVKMIDLFKEKQRQAITQTLKELEEYDKASLLGKLKRLLST